MTTEETRNEILREMANATPEVRQLVMLYAAGIKDAGKNPDGAAAKIVAEIQQKMEQGASLQEINDLTLQLAGITPERN